MKESILKKSSIAIVVATAFLAVTALLPFSVSAAPGKSEAAKAAKPGTSTIVGIVTAPDGEFDVLQAAVIRAGLVDALNGGRQFTVFAPTDAAFVSSLGVGNETETIAYINSLPPSAVANILTYHVMSGRHTSTSVLARDSYRMLNGSILNKAQLGIIAQANISASNGVIHVINSVLSPQP